jgi:hypothetical protein
MWIKAKNARKMKKRDEWQEVWETHNSGLSTPRTIKEGRRVENASIDLDGARRIDGKTKAAEIFGLAVLEDLKSLDDRFEAGFGFLGSEFEDGGRLLRWDLFAHDLSGDDGADFEGEKGAGPNL